MKDRQTVWNTPDDQALEITGVHYPKVPVVRRPDYEIAFEQFGEHTFSHCRLLTKWSPDIRDALKKDFEAALELHGGPLLVLVDKDNPQLRKFCGLFGFEHAMNITKKDGSDAEILIRRKEQQHERVLPVKQ